MTTDAVVELAALTMAELAALKMTSQQVKQKNKILENIWALKMTCCVECLKEQLIKIFQNIWALKMTCCEECDNYEESSDEDTDSPLPVSSRTRSRTQATHGTKVGARLN